MFLLLSYHKSLHHNNYIKRIEKGLFFNCDNKYSKGHKYNEKNLFYINCEEEETKEEEAYQEDVTSE